MSAELFTIFVFSILLFFLLVFFFSAKGIKLKTYSIKGENGEVIVVHEGNITKIIATEHNSPYKVTVSFNPLQLKRLINSLKGETLLENVQKNMK